MTIDYSLEYYLDKAFLHDPTNGILETFLQSSHSQGYRAVVCRQQDCEASSDMD